MAKTYYCAQLTHGFYKVIVGEGNPPSLSVAGKTAIGTSTNSRYGIWVFGPDKQDIWVAGAGTASTSTTSVLWRSQDGGSSWTNEYARVPGTPPEQSTFGPIHGQGDSAAGNLWIGGSAAFVGYRLIRSPDPLNGDPFSAELSSAIVPFSYIHGVEGPTRIWTVLANTPAASPAQYFDGTSWTASNMAGMVHRPPATMIWRQIGVWVDGPNNKVYVLAHDNNFPPHAYIFSKAADQPTAAWTEDTYFGAIYTTGPSPAIYGFPRYLHGCQASGALYFSYSGLTNTATLQRRDPSSGTWSIVKSTGTSGGNNDLYVVDDDHLMAYPIVKNPTGYYQIGVDVGSLPGGEAPRAVWSEIPPTLYFVTVDIEEGSGSGFDNIYDGYEFVQPYVQGSIVMFDDSDGHDGYNFEVKKDTDLVLGQITIDATVDGYEDPINIEPEAGQIDVSRDSTIKFRVRKGS